jgi:hypothetical protein
MPDDIQSESKADRRIGGLYPPAPGPGRPKGSVNKTTLAQKAFASRVLGDPGTPAFDEFVASTRKQLLAGILPPVILTLILHYAYGKPKETVEVQGGLEVTEVRRVVVRASATDFLDQQDAPQPQKPVTH